MRKELAFWVFSSILTCSYTVFASPADNLFMHYDFSKMNASPAQAGEKDANAETSEEASRPATPLPPLPSSNSQTTGFQFVNGPTGSLPPTLPQLPGGIGTTIPRLPPFNPDEDYLTCVTDDGKVGLVSVEWYSKSYLVKVPNSSAQYPSARPKDPSIQFHISMPISHMMAPTVKSVE